MSSPPCRPAAGPSNPPEAHSAAEPASAAALRSAESEAWPRGAPRVGARARRERRITSAQIALFTELSGDRNPLHYDEPAARATRFGGIVVQGGVTSSILNAIVAHDLPGPGTVFLHVDWRFTAPVRPGDTIAGEVELLEVRLDKPITRLATRVVRQDGVVALDGTAVCYTFALPGS